MNCLRQVAHEPFSKEVDAFHPSHNTVPNHLEFNSAFSFSKRDTKWRFGQIQPKSLYYSYGCGCLSVNSSSFIKYIIIFVMDQCNAIVNGKRQCMQKIGALKYLASTYLLHALPFSIENYIALIPYKYYNTLNKTTDIHRKAATPIAIFELCSCGPPTQAGTVWTTS